MKRVVGLCIVVFGCWKYKVIHNWTFSHEKSNKIQLCKLKNYSIRLVFVKDSILGNWPKYERRRREENRARSASASAEGARVCRRRKASAASLSPEVQKIPRSQLTISGAKLLQRPHKLDKLQFLGLWHRLLLVLFRPFAISSISCFFVVIWCRLYRPIMVVTDIEINF